MSGQTGGIVLYANEHSWDRTGVFAVLQHQDIVE